MCAEFMFHGESGVYEAMSGAGVDQSLEGVVGSIFGSERND
jgi:hypothetical protein